MTFLAWMMSLSPDFVVAHARDAASVMMSLVTRVFVRSSPPRALMFSIQRRMTSARAALEEMPAHQRLFLRIHRADAATLDAHVDDSSIVRVDSSMRTRSTDGSAR